MEKFVIAVYVDNQFGVLTPRDKHVHAARLQHRLADRGRNGNAGLLAHHHHDDGTGYARDQLINQLRKLFNVKRVEVLDPATSFERELMLLKVENNAATRQDVLAAVDIFRAKIIDYTPTALCIEVTGEPSKINAFIENMKPYGIRELCRTGIVALERGAGSLLEKEQ